MMSKSSKKIINSQLFLIEHQKDILRLLNKWMNTKFYDIRQLLACDSQYLMVFGEKSNGKSTAGQMVMCIIYQLFQAESILLRLYDEDFKKGRAEGMFGGLPQGFIKDITNGKWETVIYKHYGWYFARYNADTDKYDLDSTPFCHRQCILNAGSSFQYPNVEFILFDEFIRKDTTRNVPDEFVEFQTVVSTIKRNKTSLQILMCGNTVNYFSVYFSEMGLSNIRKQLQGSIDRYYYGTSNLSVSVEYAETPKDKNQRSNDYFAFNNPKLDMITKGSWMLDIYPHLPMRYRPKDICLKYYIKFDNKMFQCDIVSRDTSTFTYIHTNIDKTPDYNIDVIFDDKADSRPNIIPNILKPVNEWMRTIASFYMTNKVFYESNETGDIIRAYLTSCR